jgi:hypothetical protein
MLKFIDEMPEDVLGIEAIGKVTHADYRDSLMPEVQKRLSTGPLKLLYVIDPEFTGYEPMAIMDDAALGIRHWREFPFIALVTDIDWIRNAVRMFVPFFPGEVRLFHISETEDAINWILNVKPAVKV